MDDMWLQQNDTKSYTFRGKTDLLGEKLNDNVICKNSHLTLPQRPRDITLLFTMELC